LKLQEVPKTIKMLLFLSEKVLVVQGITNLHRQFTNAGYKQTKRFKERLVQALEIKDRITCFRCTLTEGNEQCIFRPM